MNEILEVLERMKLECDGLRSCADCAFYTMSKSGKIKGCAIVDLIRELMDYPKYWNMNEIKEILKRD